MHEQCKYTLVCHVHQPHSAIFRSARQQFSVLVRGETCHLPFVEWSSVRSEHVPTFANLWAPQSHCCVLTSRHDESPVASEITASHRTFVTRKHLHTLAS